MQYTNIWFSPVYVHLSHNRLYLREILHTMDILTTVRVFGSLGARRIDYARVFLVFVIRDSTYPAFNNCMLIDNELWSDGNFVPRQA